MGVLPLPPRCREGRQEGPSREPEKPPEAAGSSARKWVAKSLPQVRKQLPTPCQEPPAVPGGGTPPPWGWQLTLPAARGSVISLRQWLPSGWKGTQCGLQTGGGVPIQGQALHGPPPGTQKKGGGRAIWSRGGAQGEPLDTGAEPLRGEGRGARGVPSPVHSAVTRRLPCSLLPHSHRHGRGQGEQITLK